MIRKVWTSRAVRFAVVLFALGAGTLMLSHWAVSGSMQADLAAGDNEMSAALNAFSLSLQLSSYWVYGVLVTHLLVGGAAWWRRDRAAGTGVLWSAALHAVLAAYVGILPAPWG